MHVWDLKGLFTFAEIFIFRVIFFKSTTFENLLPLSTREMFTFSPRVLNILVLSHVLAHKILQFIYLYLLSTFFFASSLPTFC